MRLRLPSDRGGASSGAGRAGCWKRRVCGAASTEEQGRVRTAARYLAAGVPLAPRGRQRLPLVRHAGDGGCR